MYDDTTIILTIDRQMWDNALTVNVNDVSSPASNTLRDMLIKGCMDAARTPQGELIPPLRKAIKALKSAFTLEDLIEEDSELGNCSEDNYLIKSKKTMTSIETIMVIEKQSWDDALVINIDNMSWHVPTVLRDILVKGCIDAAHTERNQPIQKAVELLESALTLEDFAKMDQEFKEEYAMG